MLQADVYSLPSREGDFASVPARAGRMSAFAISRISNASTTVILPESTISVLITAALLPVAAAGVAVASTPEQVDAYVLVGSTLSVLLSLAWLRYNKPAAGFWPMTFTVLAAFSLGWLLPEAVVWWAMPESVQYLPKKAWAFIALLFGLCGTVVIAAFLKSIEKRLPDAVDHIIVSRLPASQNLPNGAEVKVTLPAAQSKTES